MAYVAIDERDPLTILMEKECPDEDRGLALQGVLCIEAAVAIGKFIKANPGKWNTFELFLENPEATQQQLADKLGIYQTTVHRHLEDTRREIGHLILNPGGKKK